MNEICVACNRPIRDDDVVLELRNGVFRNGARYPSSIHCSTFAASCMPATRTESA